MSEDTRQHQEDDALVGLGIEGLPPELEDDWVDASAGLPESAALAAHLDAHPALRAELAALQAMCAALEEDRAAKAPGAHFFAALHEEIVAGLERPAAPVVLSGHEVEATPTREPSPGWLGWLRELVARRPTLTWGVAMGVALLGVVLWTAAGLKQPQTPAPDEGSVAANTFTPKTALSDDELRELRTLADQIDVDLGVGVGEDEEESAALEAWGGGVVGLLEGADEDDLAAFEREMGRPL